MPLSIYDLSVPVFAKFLTNLSAILDKAAAHCDARKIDPAALGRNVAAMATWAFVVADRQTRWAGAPPPPSPDAGSRH